MAMNLLVLAQILLVTSKSVDAFRFSSIRFEGVKYGLEQYFLCDLYSMQI
jgi:hypothetical protein